MALILETVEEKAWADASAGFAPKMVSVQKPYFWLRAESLKPEWLSDRGDGVDLLSAALGHASASGQLRDFLLLFERAFGLRATQLHKKLAQFLRGSGQGYTHAEVMEWIAYRHPLSHADRGTPLVREAGLRRYVGRMEEAAYDVLFNKTRWHDSSMERRDVWRPPARTRAPEGKSIEGYAGMDWDLRAELFDQFGAFRLDLDAGLISMPDDWWYKHAPSKPDAGADEKDEV